MFPVTGGVKMSQKRRFKNAGGFCLKLGTIKKPEPDIRFRPDVLLR
jgi:hypothetical protein